MQEKYVEPNDCVNACQLGDSLTQEVTEVANLGTSTVRYAFQKIYGTQFYESKGKLMPRPIRNIDKLNERRKRMGLEPFEVYKKKIIKHK